MQSGSLVTVSTSSKSPRDKSHNEQRLTNAEHQREVNMLVEKFTKTLQHQLASHYGALIKKRLLDERGGETIRMAGVVRADDVIYDGEDVRRNLAGGTTSEAAVVALPPIHQGPTTSSGGDITPLPCTIPSQLANITLPALASASITYTSGQPSPDEPALSSANPPTSSQPCPNITQTSIKLVGQITNPLRDAALTRITEERIAKEASQAASLQKKIEKQDKKWSAYLQTEEDAFKILVKENPAVSELDPAELRELLEMKMLSLQNNSANGACSKGLFVDSPKGAKTPSSSGYGGKRPGKESWSVTDTVQEVRLYKQKLRHDRIKEWKIALALKKKKEEVAPWRQSPVSALLPDMTPKGIAIIEDVEDSPTDEVTKQQASGTNAAKKFWSPRQDLRQAVLQRRRVTGLSSSGRSSEFPARSMKEGDDPLRTDRNSQSSYTRTYASDTNESSFELLVDSIIPRPILHPHPPSPSHPLSAGSSTSNFNNLQQREQSASGNFLNRTYPNPQETTRSSYIFNSANSNNDSSSCQLSPVGPNGTDRMVNMLLTKMQGPYKLGSRDTMESVERDIERIKFAHNQSMREMKQKIRGVTGEVRTVFGTLNHIFEGPQISNRAQNRTSRSKMTTPSLPSGSSVNIDDIASASHSSAAGASLTSHPATNAGNTPIHASSSATPTPTSRFTHISKERKETRERLLETCQELDTHIERVNKENLLLISFVQQGYEGLQSQVQQITQLSNEDLQDYMKKYEETQRQKSIETKKSVARRSTTKLKAISTERSLSLDMPEIEGLKSGITFLSALKKEASYMKNAVTFFEERKRDIDGRKDAKFIDPAAEVIGSVIGKMQAQGTDLTKIVATSSETAAANTLNAPNQTLIRKLSSTRRSQTSVFSTSAIIPYSDLDSPKHQHSAFGAGRDKDGGATSICITVGFALKEASGEEGGGGSSQNPLFDVMMAEPPSAGASRKPSPTPSHSSSARTAGGAASIFSSSRWSSPRTLHRIESNMSSTSVSPSVANSMYSMSPSRRTNNGGGGGRRVARGHKRKKKAKMEDPKQHYTFSRKQIDIANINQIIETVRQEKIKLEEGLSTEHLAQEELERKRRVAARSNDIALQIALVLETHEKKSELLTDVDISRVENLIQDSDVMIARLTAVRDRISATVEEKDTLKKDLSANVTSDINELDELLTRTDAETRYARIQRKHLVAKYWEWRKLREVGDESAALSFFEQLKRGPKSQETGVQNCIQVETMPDQLRRFARLVRKEESISRLVRGIEVTIGDLELSNREIQELLCCPCCQQPFVNAVSLWPCGHTFCQECAESAKVQLSRGVHRCPKCSTVGTEGSMSNPIVEEVIAKWEVMERGYMRMRQALKAVKQSISKIQQKNLQRRMTAVSGTVVVDQLVAAGVAIDEGWSKYTGASMPVSVLQEMERKAKASEREDENIYNLEASHNKAHVDFIRTMNSFHMGDNYHHVSEDSSGIVNNSDSVTRDEYTALVLLPKSSSHAMLSRADNKKSPTNRPLPFFSSGMSDRELSDREEEYSSGGGSSSEGGGFCM